MLYLYFIFFFFSSRRRHTRCGRDWSSDVCSSDLRFGSLEVGKVADLVLYDGDPFENTTHVTHTLLGGRVVYDRAEYLKLPFERRALPLVGGGVGCCLGAW